MKRVLIFMSFFFFAAIGSYADEEQRVKLDDERTKRVRLDYCNIFVTKVESDNDGNAKVTVEVENIDESNVIILFGRAYPEKELKKLSPSIIFEKKYPGTKGHRKIDTYKESRKDFFIKPENKIKLPVIQVKSGEVRQCRLPFYFAKYKNKKRRKMLLMEKNICILDIEVEKKTDEDFIRLESECNSLIKEVSKQKFCNNPRHEPPLKDQESPYKSRINKIKTDIDDIVSRHNWYRIDKEYKRYSDLKQKLDKIDFTTYEGDCGNHRIIPPSTSSTPSSSTPRHNCRYCNSSFQQIYQRLDDYYMMIYNSSNRRETKGSVMADVNTLYRCCTDRNCSRHSSSWNSSEYKARIIDRYNRISNF